MFTLRSRSSPRRRVCESAVSYIDGEEGVLLYRVYSIEQIAEHGDFLETCYLMLYGQLPNAVQEEGLRLQSLLGTRWCTLSRWPGSWGACVPRRPPDGRAGGERGERSPAFYHDTTDISDPKQRMVASFRLIGKMPTLAAMAYKYSLGQPFIYPKNELDYASNFLHMCFAVPCEDYKINPVVARALDRIFILYADHEQNPSTSTVRLAGSSGANPFACIAAGVACLWGPAHGGASEAAFKMLMEIVARSRISRKFIARAKDKNDPFRLMGVWPSRSTKTMIRAPRSCRRHVTMS